MKNRNKLRYTNELRYTTVSIANSTEAYSAFLIKVKKSTRPFSLNDVYITLGKGNITKRNIKKLLEKGVKKGVIKLVSKDLYARKDLDLVSL